MNANELAEDLEGAKLVILRLNEMLRQQQAEILAGKIMIKGYSKTIDEQQAEIESLKSAKIRAYNNGVEDGRKPNTNNEPVAWDRGTWTVGETESQEFIESSDFNHDVRLYLNGDFEDNTQRLNYLKHIADRLNIHPVKELTETDLILILEVLIDSYDDTNRGFLEYKAMYKNSPMRKARIDGMKRMVDKHTHAIEIVEAILRKARAK